MADMAAAGDAHGKGDVRRRRAAHLYGLIVTGAVLAASPSDIRLVRVTLVLVGTLIIYWAAESYVHWIAARTDLGRGLRPHEQRVILLDGWPLVSSCLVPVLFLAAEALFRIETSLAVTITLLVNTVLLFTVGWRMSRAGGLRGVELVVSAATTGMLGIAMIALKTALH